MLNISALSDSTEPGAGIGFEKDADMLQGVIKMLSD